MLLYKISLIDLQTQGQIKILEKFNSNCIINPTNTRLIRKNRRKRLKYHRFCGYIRGTIELLPGDILLKIFINKATINRVWYSFLGYDLKFNGSEFCLFSVFNTNFNHNRT